MIKSKAVSTAATQPMQFTRSGSLTGMLSVCRLIMGARQQQAQHNQARRKRDHYSQKKPVIRFHSHTARPYLPPVFIIVAVSTANIAIDRAPRPPIGLFHEKK
jgi:hypothetical protein